ncbi:ribonuclease P protein component [Xylanimonas oleitrophica]|uniref:Ribonuclease P protein component n=1 Tax=Xylanimonas oleitrophica TaxID=2607479 RepID=A0A2W5XT28_9MICO|nr:ribonuclease P protein component [Xylanimonas oleitrophica]PZR53158.1 ribonuclease P protein component [Xylanimonas oleitrophica]
MLPAAHRLRRPVEFERTVRRGARAGRSTVVVHLLVDDEGDAPPQVGLVVSKAVGNAVQRNLVKRRLRALVRSHVLDAAGSLPPRTRVVVRALPPAASATYAELGRDVSGALGKAARRAAGDSTSPRTASPV